MEVSFWLISLTVKVVTSTGSSEAKNNHPKTIATEIAPNMLYLVRGAIDSPEGGAVRSILRLFSRSFLSLIF